jgi:thiamine transporter ThiT
MTPETSKMKSIWYLVSLVLLEMGGLVVLAGIIDLVVPSARRTVLAEIHPGLWWGCVMIIAGTIFFFKNRK